MLKYHGGENVNQVFRSFYRIYSHFNYLLSIINFGTFHKLHGNNPLLTILFVVVWDIDIWIGVEVMLTFECIC